MTLGELAALPADVCRRCIHPQALHTIPFQGRLRCCLCEWTCGGFEGATRWGSDAEGQRSQDP